MSATVYGFDALCPVCGRGYFCKMVTPEAQQAIIEAGDYVASQMYYEHDCPHCRTHLRVSAGEINKLGINCYFNEEYNE